jgi:hypothetical protein
MHPRPFGNLARHCLTKPEIAKERHQHRAATFHPASQGMADDLHLFGPGQIRDFSGEYGRVKSHAGEEIDIDRLPMSEPQCQCGPAILREMLGRSV